MVAPLDEIIRPLMVLQKFRQLFALKPKEYQKKHLSMPTYWSLLRLTSPRLYYLHQTLSTEMCNELIAMASPQIGRSRVVSENGMGDRVDSIRSSSGMFLLDPLDAASPANVFLRGKISSAVGLPSDFCEATQILRYLPGEQYVPHLDAFDDEKTLKRGGQRIVSSLTWLSQHKGGGSTYFPEGRFTLPAHRGDSVFFYDVTQEGVTDLAALHGGLPGSGDKWLAVVWCHQEAFL